MQLDFGEFIGENMRILCAVIVLLITLTITASTQSTGNRSLDSLLKRGDQDPLAGLTLYALDNDNTLWVRAGCSDNFRKLTRLQVNSQVIGIDFRVADQWLYALTDNGSIYQVDVSNAGLGNTVLVSNLTPRFAGGVQSLMDFNPVANALRLIGSNDQNFAIVNGGGNLQTTVPQSTVTYAAGDVNGPKTLQTPVGIPVIVPGIDPNLVGGAYTNNVAGARTTLFYAIDFDLHTLVTIAGPLVGAGSSNTGGGQLQTIGQILTASGNVLQINPTADLDIYTNDSGFNSIVGITGRTLFYIDLQQINTALPLGTTQQVFARTYDLKDGGFIDVAVGLQKPSRCVGN